MAKPTIDLKNVLTYDSILRSPIKPININAGNLISGGIKNGIVGYYKYGNVAYGVKTIGWDDTNASNLLDQVLGTQDNKPSDNVTAWLETTDKK